MPFINARELKVSDSIVGDSHIKIWLSKPYHECSLINPEFGQNVTVRSTAAAGDTSITVLPLYENLAVGRELPFASGTAVVAAPALHKNTTITVAPLPAALKAFESATTLGIEQSVVLAKPVAVGDRSITVSAVSSWIEANRVLNFDNKTKLKTMLYSPDGATEIMLHEPAQSHLPAGKNADLPFYSQISSTKDIKTLYNNTVEISDFNWREEAISKLYELKENSRFLGYQISYVMDKNVDHKEYGGVQLGSHSSKKIQLILEPHGTIKNV